MLKKYPFGIVLFILLGLIATLFPPYKWGAERHDERIFPIEERGFFFGSSWGEIQTGWEWEETKEGEKSDSIRKSFYDSLADDYWTSPFCSWMRQRLIPRSRSDETFDLSGLRYGIDNKPMALPLSTKLARRWLSNLRRKFPQYATVNDSLLSVNFTNECPPKLSAEEFARDMDNDSVRAERLLLFSELGLITRDSLDVINARLAPPLQKYHSTREYALLHRQLNLAELFVDYLIIMFFAALIEVGRYLLGLLRQKEENKKHEEKIYT